MTLNSLNLKFFKFFNFFTQLLVHRKNFFTGKRLFLISKQIKKLQNAKKLKIKFFNKISPNQLQSYI